MANMGLNAKTKGKNVSSSGVRTKEEHQSFLIYVYVINFNDLISNPKEVVFLHKLMQKSTAFKKPTSLV